MGAPLLHFPSSKYEQFGTVPRYRLRRVRYSVVDHSPVVSTIVVSRRAETPVPRPYPIETRGTTNSRGRTTAATIFISTDSGPDTFTRNAPSNRATENTYAGTSVYRRPHLRIPPNIPVNGIIPSVTGRPPASSQFSPTVSETRIHSASRIPVDIPTKSRRSYGSRVPNAIVESVSGNINTGLLLEMMNLAPVSVDNYAADGPSNGCAPRTAALQPSVRLGSRRGVSEGRCDRP